MSFSLPVLVVDDSSSMRLSLRGILKNIGFKNILLFEDGREALQYLEKSSLVKASNVGLILCDLAMPNMDGMELLKTIRKNSPMKNIPFIMVTSENRTERILEVAKQGSNEFIVKPFTADLLAEKIKKVLGA